MYVMYQSGFFKQPLGRGFNLRTIFLVRGACYSVLEKAQPMLVRNRVQLGNSTRFASRYDKEAFLKKHVFRYMVSLADPDQQTQLFEPYYRAWLKPETVRVKSGVLIGYHTPNAYQYAMDLLTISDLGERPIYLWMARVGLPSAIPSWTFGTLCRKDPAIREPMLPETDPQIDMTITPKLEEYYRRFLRNIDTIYDKESYRSYSAFPSAEERFFLGLAYAMNCMIAECPNRSFRFSFPGQRFFSVSEMNPFPRLDLESVSDFTPNVGLESAMEPKGFPFAAFGTGLLTRHCRINFFLENDVFGLRNLRVHQLLYSFFREEPDKSFVRKILTEWIRNFGGSKPDAADENESV